MLRSCSSPSSSNDATRPSASAVSRARSRTRQHLNAIGQMARNIAFVHDDVVTTLSGQSLTRRVTRRQKAGYEHSDILTSPFGGCRSGFSGRKARRCLSFTIIVEQESSTRAASMNRAAPYACQVFVANLIATAVASLTAIAALKLPFQTFSGSIRNHARRNESNSASQPGTRSRTREAQTGGDAR